MRRAPLLAVALALSVQLAAAAEPTHDITPEDYFSLATITEIAVAPDGKQVAYVQATWDKADDSRKSDLWLVATDGKLLPRRLTFDRANDRHPKWSADGQTIYFLGNRKRANEKAPHDGTAQVWSIRTAEGAEPRAVTRVAGGVSGYDLAPQAGAVFYVTDTTATDEDDFSKLRAQYPADYGHGTRKVSEVHKLDLATWRSEKLIAEKRYVREFAVTRDGKRVAMVTAFDDSILKSEGESRVDVWEAGKVTTPPTEVYRKKAASPWAWLESLSWSPDGERFAFCAIFDAYPAQIIIGAHEENRWTLKKHGVPTHPRGYGTPLLWDNSGLVSLCEASGKVGFCKRGFGKRGPNPEGNWIVFEPGQVIYLFDFSPEGVENGMVKWAWLSGGEDAFPELVYHARGDDTRRLTKLNPQTESWKLPTVRHITWKAPDGAEVGGVLELPYGYKKGDKLPLVVAIHGGPTTSAKADLSFDPHNGRLYFAAKGYAVLCPNYRGSTGYGDKFVTDLIGNENDIEVKDILAGIQHLIKEGIADPERVGVMGWSNGGYLTNCLITLKDPPVKIRAASSGAGILDTVAEWGFNDEPAYPRVLKKGLPWETPDVYRKTSPTYGLGHVVTPTLIHVGAGDERCPPGHSRMLYRALKEYVQVPAELVVYPGEPHGLTKMSHRRAKMEWDLAWFEKYLKK